MANTVVLQSVVTQEDKVWQYTNVQIPHPPKKSKGSDQDQTILIKFVAVTENAITLSLTAQSPNRILISDNPDKFINISFANFRFSDNSPKVAADYIEGMLKTGLHINGQSYYFYGHSNSQLKSRTCYLFASISGESLFNKINQFGNFSNIKSINKRAKRIGLLFSAAETQFTLDARFTLDIEDIEDDNGHIFTDGCGMISNIFADHIQKKKKIIYYDSKYVPSVFQIRYKGYKGTLMVNPQLPKPHHIHFRESMKKFKGCGNDSFSVLEYSKPYTFGYLNGELVTLLSTLGIKDDIFLAKQKQYFDFLKKSCHDPQTAFKYLCYKGENGQAEKYLLNGSSPELLTHIKKLQQDEWKGCFKGEKVKVRIMIPKSRLLFGVCDYTNTLKEGEVHVRLTHEDSGILTLDGAEVIVGRNPCLHPGDVRKFKAVFNENLKHLKDCIVFPVVGSRDAPSLMSGGDLDGDKFFVSWDEEIIPETLYEPYGYPPAKEAPTREITHDLMIRYFAQYNNSSLGKVKNLYLDWAKWSPNKAGSKECQELNALFSSCVDGERVNIPGHLQLPPKPEGGKKFILDILCDEVIKIGRQIFQHDIDAALETPEEFMEILLTSGAICMDEFELFQLTAKWCRARNYPIQNLLYCFNFGAFTTQQKHAAAAMFDRNIERRYFRMLFNSLHESNLLSEQQIKEAKLHSMKIRWQRLYSSEDDGGSRLSHNLAKAMELFQKKLIVFRVNDRLTVAMYIPLIISQGEEIDVGLGKNNSKHFAFCSDGKMYPRWAERKYKIYYDGDVLQLYDSKRPNTFIWFALQTKNYPSRVPGSEYKVSIALDKFSGQLRQSSSRVTKQEAKGVEIYVISNRDKEGHQLLDISMSQVDTKIIVPLATNIPKEYNLKVELNKELWRNPELCEAVIFQGNFSKLREITNVAELQDIFEICFTQLDQDAADKTFLSIVDVLLTHLHEIIIWEEIWKEIFNWIDNCPGISSALVKKLHENIFGDDDQDIENKKDLGRCTNENQYVSLMNGLIMSANFAGDLIFDAFDKLVQVLNFNKLSFSLGKLTSFVQKIVCFIRHADIAEKLLHDLFDDEKTQIFNFNSTSTTDTLTYFQYLKHFILALSLDYLGEVKDNCPCDYWGIPYGAENIVNEIPVQNGKPSYKSRLEIERSLADFIPNKTLGPTKGEIVCDNFRGTNPIPEMKCLIIEKTEKHAKYKTILRTDILNKIRNGEHLRFCASRRSMDMTQRRITVFDVVADSIKAGKLEFELKQRIPKEMLQASWNVYICTSTTTFNAMIAAINNLISLKEKSTSCFRSILELPPRTPNNDYDEIESKDADIPPNKFNATQIEAIKIAINNPLTLVWGPPGTGKTTVVVEILLQFILSRPALRILVAASTHNAVDNVLSRFVKERALRFKDEKSQKSDDVIRITSDLKKVSVELKKWTLDAFVGGDIHTNDKAKAAALKKLSHASLVFTTCSGAGVGLLRPRENKPEENDDDDEEDENNGGKGKKKKKQKEQKFDVVIVDEASQVTEPNALIPIVKGSRFVILVGDHVQLRPTVSQTAKDCGLETSLFEKLYTSTKGSCKKIMLNYQYRMHPQLATFPSQCFYNGELLSGVTEESRILSTSKFPWPKYKENVNKVFPVAFVNCEAQSSFGTGSTSKINNRQAEITVNIIKALLQVETGEALQSICVLSPYTKQVSLIEGKIKAANLKVEVKTIDSFQGRESDIIIYSTVVCNGQGPANLGFLDDFRRMNVALTRAKFGLVVIGSENTLKENELWGKCIESCQKVEFPVAIANTARS